MRKRRRHEKPFEPKGLVKLPVWAVVALVPVLSALAFGLRDIHWLLALTAANIAFVFLLMGSLVPLWRERRYFVIQTTVITGLYCLQNGGLGGVVPGLTTSWQLMLAFAPGIVMMKTVPNHKLVELFERFIPYRMAFVISTSLRFIPLLIAEARNIWEAQVLRGARILPRDFADPRNWPEAVRCLVVPVIVQGMKIAGEVSQSATARGFGLRDRRTHWPGAPQTSLHSEITT